MAGRILFVGIGSAHGDDQVGWCVAAELAARRVGCLDVRRAAHPAEVLDWLGAVEQLAVCDGCLTDAPPGTLLRWDWPTEELRRARFWGSHDLSLTAVLELAEQLGALPQRVTVWGISIARAEPGEELSAALAAAIPQIVEKIAQRLEQSSELTS